MMPKARVRSDFLQLSLKYFGGHFYKTEMGGKV